MYISIERTFAFFQEANSTCIRQCLDRSITVNTRRNKMTANKTTTLCQVCEFFGWWFSQVKARAILNWCTLAVSLPALTGAETCQAGGIQEDVGAGTPCPAGSCVCTPWWWWCRQSGESAKRQYKSSLSLPWDYVCSSWRLVSCCCRSLTCGPGCTVNLGIGLV